MAVSNEKRNSTASFVVRVYYTENGTWQGQVAHVQTGAVHNFQSMLEMIRFMDENLAQEQRAVPIQVKEG